MSIENMPVSMPIGWKPPKWLKDCPFASGWCRYNGHIYYADLNFDKSAAANEPIFDLAYCATKALNDIYLFSRPWNKKKFSRWKGHSSW